MINGLCRARKSASLVMSAWGRPLKDLAFKDRDWANDIEGVVTLACADPRVLRPTSADFWPPSHMHAALRLQSHLRRWDYSVDRVGDALLVYKGEKATKYQGAFVLQPGLGEFSAEAYREKGFGFAAAIEVNAPIFDRAQGGVNDEIIALLKPYIAMINDDERARSFRNTVATLAAKSRN